MGVLVGHILVILGDLDYGQSSWGYWWFEILVIVFKHFIKLRLYATDVLMHPAPLVVACRSTHHFHPSVLLCTSRLDLLSRTNSGCKNVVA